MVELSEAELKRCQLDILSAVHNFCLKNNLGYSLAYGTLLGAVRHKGYIPWDDDIDIMMPREDYDIFLKTFEDERYKVIDSSIDCDYSIPFAKVFDTQTILLEKSNNKAKIGVNIDVFPIDNFPESLDASKRFLHRKKIWDNIHVIKSIRYSKKRNPVKSLALAIGKLFVCPLKLSFVTEKIKALSQKHNASDSNYCGIISITDGSLRDRFPIKVFELTRPVSFENREFMIIDDYDAYLSSVYGEYMIPPPAVKQITHHAFKAYWR